MRESARSSPRVGTLVSLSPHIEPAEACDSGCRRRRPAGARVGPDQVGPIVQRIRRWPNSRADRCSVGHRQPEGPGEGGARGGGEQVRVEHQLGPAEHRGVPVGPDAAPRQVEEAGSRTAVHVRAADVRRSVATADVRDVEPPDDLLGVGRTQVDDLPSALHADGDVGVPAAVAAGQLPPVDLDAHAADDALLHVRSARARVADLPHAPRRPAAGHARPPRARRSRHAARVRGGRRPGRGGRGGRGREGGLAGLGGHARGRARAGAARRR